MSLTLYYHPLSSYCWKALIGLYETETPFEPLLVNLGDEESRTAFLAVWPLGKFPVIKNTVSGEVVPETSIVLEYVDRDHQLIPADPEAARKARLWDRVFDLHVHEQMGRIVFERIRPTEHKDPFGLERAQAQLATAYDLLEVQVPADGWFSGGEFGLVDCAAAPALHYGNRVMPLMPAHPKLAAYLARLEARPSVQRVLSEAQPYAHMFPQA